MYYKALDDKEFKLSSDLLIEIIDNEKDNDLRLIIKINDFILGMKLVIEMLFLNLNNYQRKKN